MYGAWTLHPYVCFMSLCLFIVCYTMIVLAGCLLLLSTEIHPTDSRIAEVAWGAGFKARYVT